MIQQLLFAGGPALLCSPDYTCTKTAACMPIPYPFFC